MRKIVVLSLLVALATSSFCQQVVQKQHLTQTDYLKKSKNQKSGGMVLLVGGIVVLAITTVASAGVFLS